MPDDPALTRIIRRVTADARAAGLDYLGQAQQAVAVVRAVRPDIAASEAMTLVERVRE